MTTLPSPTTLTPQTPEERLRRLQGRLEREHRARLEAERLLETKALALYEANQRLELQAADLERRVEQRTHELVQERQRALRAAEVDALTGIANRASFARQLGELLAPGAGAPEAVAVLLIDLDDFKAVNDSLGHAAGDSLLVEVARRLVETVRPGDVVARLGGDEFAVIARGVGLEQAALSMAHRLLRRLCQPVVLGQRSIPCSCSIGVAEVDSSGGHHRPQDLLSDADLALYASKRAGRARVTSFESTLRADLERRAALEAEVRLAVLNGEIEPWYQPIVRRSDGCWAGAELLARWRLPSGELRPPAAFLPAVESLGLLDTMMENMLRLALREGAGLVTGGRLAYLSVNVSPTQFNQGWAQRRLPELLAETGFPGRALVVEITETALLHDLERTRAMLQALRDAGMRIALDDFGVGYSNFSLLRHLPFDLLKLDRSLISDIAGDDEARALAECFLQLGARLRLKVVAEGVETQRQAELLAAAGCAAMQGYWFARPQRLLDCWFAQDAPPPTLAWTPD